jgi:hypothetical protein
MFTVATAATFARQALVEAETDPLVWHNVAVVSDAIHTLKGSKRQANVDLGETLSAAMLAYFTARNA